MSTAAWFENKYAGLKALAERLIGHSDPEIQAAGHEVTKTVDELRAKASTDLGEAEKDGEQLADAAAADAAALAHDAQTAAKPVEAAAEADAKQLEDTVATDAAVLIDPAPAAPAPTPAPETAVEPGVPA